MVTGAVNLRGAPDADNRRCRELLAWLSWHTTKCGSKLALPEWQPLALAALMQHKLGRLSASALLGLLVDLDKMVWMWALCSTTKPQRIKRTIQVCFIIIMYPAAANAVCAFLVSS